MYLTVQEAAEKLSVTPATIYSAVKEGRLAAEKQYGRMVLREAAVAAYGSTVGKRNGYETRVKQVTKPKLSILGLRGLGKEIWKDVDTDSYINELRNEWDRPE